MNRYCEVCKKIRRVKTYKSEIDNKNNLIEISICSCGHEKTFINFDEV